MSTPQQATAPKPQQKVRVPDVAPIPNLERYAECGDVVEWFPSADKNEPPQTAIVTKIEMPLEGRVVANVMSPDWGDTRPMDGCHHVDDPRARLDGNSDGGGWRHKPITILLRKMLLASGAMWWQGGRLVEKPEFKPAVEPKPQA